MAIETYSKVRVISDALILLGEREVISLTDERKGVKAAANLFERVYENELQSNPWRFSMKKAALSRLNLTPLNQFTYVHQMPSDCLLPRHVYPATLYEIFGNRIYSNQLTIELDYQFKPEVSAAPAYFTTLLAYALARDLASPLTEKRNKVDEFMTKYVAQRDRAMYADAQSRPATMVQHNPFTDVRG